MKLTVVAAGRLKEAAFRDLADEYMRRVGRFTKLVEVEAKDDAALERALPACDHLIALEVWGKQCSSEQFSEMLERWGTTGKGEIVFALGGAEGIPKTLSRRAGTHLSLSKMTLPHRLARVVLYEQIYRGLSILRGEPYAREG